MGDAILTKDQQSAQISSINKQYNDFYDELTAARNDYQEYKNEFLTKYFKNGTDTSMVYYFGYPFQLSDVNGLMLYKASMACPLLHGDIQFTRMFILSEQTPKDEEAEMTFKLIYIFYDILKNGESQGDNKFLYKGKLGKLSNLCVEFRNNEDITKSYADFKKQCQEMNTKLNDDIKSDSLQYSKPINMDSFSKFTLSNSKMVSKIAQIQQLQNQTTVNIQACVNRLQVNAYNSNITDFKAEQKCEQLNATNNEAKKTSTTETQ